jgi:hypothetical protein
MKVLFHFLFMFPVTFGMTQENISCDCTISYNGMNPGKGNHYTFTVSKEELTEVPPPSETYVNYITDYELEKDSLGRVSKMIRTDHSGGTIEERNYIYDQNNRLIREKVYFKHPAWNNSSLYKEEQIDFTYDENGKRIRKVTKVTYIAKEEVTLEECTYSY